MAQERIKYLDGLRGLAAMLIILHHYALAFLPGVFSKAAGTYHLPGSGELWLYNTPLKLPLAGIVWLFVFLILSGWVMTWTFIQMGRRRQHLIRSSINRYFRLVGPVVATGGLIWLALKLNLAFNQKAAEISRSWFWLGTMWRFEPNFLIMLKQSLVEVYFKIIPMETVYNSSLWVVPFFFLGSFLLMAVLALAAWQPRWRWLIYGISLILLIKTWYFSLLIGVILAERVSLKSKISWSKSWQIGLFLGFIYFGTYPSWTDKTLMAGSWYDFLPQVNLANQAMFYPALGATLLLILLMGSPRLQNMLSQSIWIGLGRISYSLYIVHLLIINTLASFILVAASPWLPYPLILILILGLCLPLTLALAYGLYRTTEVRAIKINWPKV
ncbi:hypothetical protein A2W24_05675 [Microgenomates group bacterium RBG_16_45_19]|nr:MAG: hypothetical protein A2W24_05675 [Microgenomates group bacterium RBG_16_45_19]